MASTKSMAPEYFVGRVIARPYVGTNKDDFKRIVGDRRDYAVPPSGTTAMDLLMKHHLMTSCIGKISDIFDDVGVTKTVHTVSNEDGMDKTIAAVKSDDFKGLCFVNLVEFDSEYGHRRNPVGYARALEAFDKRLAELLPLLKEDDLLMITADHEIEIVGLNILKNAGGDIDAFQLPHVTRGNRSAPLIIKGGDIVFLKNRRIDVNARTRNVNQID